MTTRDVGFLVERGGHSPPFRWASVVGDSAARRRRGGASVRHVLYLDATAIPANRFRFCSHSHMEASDLVRRIGPVV